VRRRTYWTGLITLGRELSQPRGPFVARGWTAKLASQKRTPRIGSLGREVIIRSSSWAVAQNALDLIQGCHCLLFGEPQIFGIRNIAHNQSEPEWMDEDERLVQFKSYCSTSDYPLACAVAARATRDSKLVYAVIKYKFSMDLYSVHCVDLDPLRAPHLSVSRSPKDHVTFCYAIVSAYSAIEDLGLEIRASAKKPSRINGEWNPVVKQDLENRLNRHHIDLSEPVLWTVRGPRRKTEKVRPLPSAPRAPWAGWTVRDVEMHISDAIANADWFRDRVASHGVTSLTRVLSPYDVINVQHLTRRLILESLGFWRWHEKK